MTALYFVITLIAGIAIGFVPLWLFVVWEWRKIERGIEAAGYKPLGSEQAKLGAPMRLGSVRP